MTRMLDALDEARMCSKSLKRVVIDGMQYQHGLHAFRSCIDGHLTTQVWKGIYITCGRVCACVRAYACACTCACMYECIRACLHVCKCVYMIYIYVYPVYQCECVCVSPACLPGLLAGWLCARSQREGETCIKR